MSEKSFIESKPIQFYHRTTLFILYIFCTAPFLYGQYDLNNSPVGKWREGSCNAVVQKDNKLFYANGCFLEIAELLEENTHLPVASYESRGRIYDLLVRDDLVFLALEKTGLSIISIEDINHPVELGFIEFSQYYPKLLLYGNYLFSFNGSGTQFKLIDISNPDLPVVINNQNIQQVNHLSLYGHHLYAACKWAGLRVYDLSDPTSVQEVYSMEGGYCFAVDIDNDVACIITSDTIRLMDITQPSSPVEFAKFKSDQGAITVKMRANRIYAAHYSLQTIDISDPQNAVYLDVEYLSSPAINLDISGNVLSIATELGVLRYESGPTGMLNLTDQFMTPGPANHVAVHDHYAYVSHYSHGISILDVAVPETPVFKEFLPVANELTSAIVKDQFLYTTNRGLGVYDISDPLNPVPLSYLGLNQPSYKMYIVGDMVYMAAGTRGLAIIDISDPLQPVLLSILDTPGIAFDLDVHPDADLVYVADWNGGLRIIDVSDPAAPAETGSVVNNFFTPLRTVKVIGQYVWLGSTNFGIYIFDISDYSNPVFIKNLNTSRGYDIQIRNQFAYVSAGYAGYYVYEISDFADPKFIQWFSTPGDVYYAAFSENLIYCSDNECGITIFEFDQCALLEMNSGQQNNVCNGYCDGSIEITGVDFAQMPIQYTWSNGQSAAALTALCSGSYTVTITDANNCQLSAGFTITEPEALSLANIEKTDITGSSGHGSISVLVSGGTAPYKYEWKGPDGFVATSKNISGLAAGCYTLTVTDANSCLLISDEICILDLTRTADASDKKKGLILFPNPAYDHFTIRFADQDWENLPMDRLEIFSATGKQVKVFENYQEKTVGIEDLYDGMYLVRITANDRILYSSLFVIKER